MIRYESIFASLNPSALTRDNFVKVYQEAFAGPPYFENYSEREVIDEIWMPHMEHGRILIATDRDSGKVLGFACAIRLEYAPDDVREYIHRQIDDNLLPPDHNIWYFSELGVLSEHRFKGIGSNLVRHMLIDMDYSDINSPRPTTFVMRTAEIGSNSAGIFKKAGWKQLEEVQDVSTLEQVVVNGSQSQRRIYMYGQTRTLMV